MPRVKTPNGVKEFSYTPGGMAAARQAAAGQLVSPKGRDAGKMGLGVLEGGMKGAAQAASMSGGNPYATGIGAVFGGIEGALSNDNISPQNQAVGETISKAASAGETLAGEFRKKDNKNPVEDESELINSRKKRVFGER